MSTDILENFLSTLSPFFTLIGSVCWLGGLSLGSIAFYHAIKVHDGQSRSGWNGVVATMFTAIVLMNLPGFMSVASQTLLGSSTGLDVTSTKALDYASQINTTGDSSVQKGLAGALYYVQFIGWIAAMRGWWMIRSAVHGVSQVTIGAGVVHIVAGVIGANITVFTPIISNFLGVTSGS
ncbi:hypothetical protein [Telmatospirillum siberiense]|uniref:Uncharacterized protein n=1 Tax=Telmatospirillum siberiense TaxID=382514 RepID=A0A2N3PNL5_9PROT|nr:hypothetical protein [Telmatospirillum siberiense]PKU22001.1 hypothetical protein CWS72_24155 [Telmatospirillum siberiense]